MLSIQEAKAKGICCYCERNVRGTMNSTDAVIYERLGLCGLCWDTALSQNKKLTEKIPTQFTLPTINDGPQIIELPATSAGRLVMAGGSILSGAVLRGVSQGKAKMLKYVIILPNQKAFQDVRDFLRGIKDVD